MKFVIYYKWKLTQRHFCFVINSLIIGAVYFFALYTQKKPPEAQKIAQGTGIDPCPAFLTKLSIIHAALVARRL